MSSRRKIPNYSLDPALLQKPQNTHCWRIPDYGPAARQVYITRDILGLDPVKWATGSLSEGILVILRGLTYLPPWIQVMCGVCQLAVSKRFRNQTSDTPYKDIGCEGRKHTSGIPFPYRKQQKAMREELGLVGRGEGKLGRKEVVWFMVQSINHVKFCSFGWISFWGGHWTQNSKRNLGEEMRTYVWQSQIKGLPQPLWIKGSELCTALRVTYQTFLPSVIYCLIRKIVLRLYISRMTIRKRHFFQSYWAHYKKLLF